MHARPNQADCHPNRCIWIAILALCMSASGWESMSFGRLHQSSLTQTWKESEADRSLDVVRTDASWHRSFSIQWRVRTEIHVIRTDGTVDRWASGQDDMSFGQLAGNRLFWLAESSKTLLNSGIHVKQHLYKQVILSKQNVANHKLTSMIFTIDYSCTWFKNSNLRIL
jgi:hypothetical protein